LGGGQKLRVVGPLDYVGDDDDYYYGGIKLLFVLLHLKLFNYAAMDNPDLEIN
jgi:hypothetical protein